MLTEIQENLYQELLEIDRENRQNLEKIGTPDLPENSATRLALLSKLDAEFQLISLLVASEELSFLQIEGLFPGKI